MQYPMQYFSMHTHAAVVIGFSDSNSSVEFIEGGPSQVICADVKSEGLELDPFDSVPLSVMITGLGKLT